MRLRGLGVVLLLACALLPAVTGAPAAAQTARPRLLVGDVAALRARAAGGIPAEAWASLKGKADGYVTPGHPSYAPPELVNPAPATFPGWAVYDGMTGQNELGTILADLGMAYLVSGDAKYGRHAAALLVAIARNGWRGWKDNELGEGDLTKGAALAFDWAYPVITATQRTEIVGSLVAELPAINPATGSTGGNGFQAASVFSCLDRDWHNQGRNHNWVGVCGGGNGLLLLAIQGEAGVPDLTPYLSVARARVDANLATYGSNGDGPEGANYASYGLHNALPFMVADGRAVPANVTRVAQWLAYEQLPGEGTRFVPRNDSMHSLPLMHEVLTQLLAVTTDGITPWLWDRTVGMLGDRAYAQTATVAPRLVGNPTCTDAVKDPTRLVFCWRSPEVFTLLHYRPPSERPRTSPAGVLPHGRWYPEYGLVTARTGWDGAQDLTLSFEAKHNQPDGHYQEDIGNFTLYGYGARFAMDQGYGHNYSCSDEVGTVQGCTAANPRMNSGRTHGHNVVLLDGRRYSQLSNAAQADHQTITGFTSTATSTLVESDLRSAYVGVGQLTSVPWAERDVLFTHPAGEPATLTVTDRLNRDGQPWQYSWNFFTDGGNALAVTDHEFRTVAPNTATMVGAVSDAHHDPVLVPMPWPNAAYGAADHAPVRWNLRSQSATDRHVAMDHLAVMAVTPPGVPPPDVEVLPARGGNVSAVRWDGGESFYASTAYQSRRVRSARLVTDAALAKVGPSDLTLVRGTVLTLDGRRVLDIAGGKGSVVLSDGVLDVRGPAGLTVTLHQTRRVLRAVVNGRPAAIQRRAGTLVVR